MRSQGLDISDSFIRLAVLERRHDQFRLPVRAEIPVPAGAVVDGELREPTQVTALLRQLFDAAGLRDRRPIVSLPERHTFIKLVPLDLNDASPAAVDKALQDVAEQHVPYPLEETTYDWQVLPKRNSLGQLQVLLGVAPKTLVDSYLQVLDQAGLDPLSLGIESIAMARATFRPRQTPGSHILLDLGRSRSTLTLVQDEVVQFSTTVRYAGKDLNHFIRDALGITDQQAEQAKSLFGLDPSRGKGVLRRVLLPQIDTLAKKVQELEDFYNEHYIDHQPIQHVALIGSGAMLRGIDQELGQRLSQPVQLQPTWVYEDLQRRDSSTPAEIGLAYATAIGLALEPFSL